MPRPLVVTADPDLLDDLLRLAAVSGTEVDVVADLGRGRSAWAAAPLVLVDDAVVVGVAGLPRRGEVVLVGRDLDDAGVWRRAVDLGAEHVVHLPDAESWLVDRLARAAAGPALGAVVGVLGGRGGAGASTLATALAVVAARRGRTVTLVDGDPLGGGLDLLLGAEDLPGLRWDDLAAASGRLAPGALDAALPVPAGVELLSWGRAEHGVGPGQAWAALLDSTTRSRQLTVVDLPRGLLDAEGTRVALGRCAPLLLLATADVRGVAAAAQVAGRAAERVGDLRLVVRTGASGGLGAEQVGRALGLPVAAELRSEAGLPAAADRGVPPGARGHGSLVRCCETLLEDLGPAA